jgi:hypothetical protein
VIEALIVAGIQLLRGKWALIDEDHRRRPTTVERQMLGTINHPITAITQLPITAINHSPPRGNARAHFTVTTSR